MNGGAVKQSHASFFVRALGKPRVCVHSPPVFINGSQSGFYYVVGSASFETETHLGHGCTSTGK